MATNDNSRCASALDPNRFRLSKKKVMGSLLCMSGGRQASAAPGGDGALGEYEQKVEQDRQQDRHGPGGDELGLEAALDGLKDRLPATPRARGGGGRRPAG